MTYQENCNLPREILETITAGGHQLTFPARDSGIGYDRQLYLGYHR